MTDKIYAPDEAVAVELVGIDGAPLFNDDGSPMTISVLGADSDAAVAARNATRNLQIQQGARGVKVTAEALEASTVQFLVKLSTGWNITPSKLIPGIDPGLGEGQVPYSAGAATKLYSNAKLSSIRDQPDAAITERARFMKASQAI